MVDSNKSFQIKCDPVSSSVSFDPSSTVSSSSTHHPTSSPPLPVHRNSPHHYPVQVNHYSHDNHLDGVSQVTSPSPSQQHQEQEQLHHLHQHQHHQPVSRYEKEYFSSSHSNYHTLGNHAVTHEHDNDDDQEEDQEYHNHEQFNAIVSSDCMSEKIYQENGEDKLSLYSPQPPPSPAPYASSSSTSTSSYKFIAHSSSASSINALTDDQRTNSNKRSIVSSNVTDQSPSPLVMASFTQVHDDDDDDDETHTMSPGQSYPTHPPVDANNGASHVNTDERVTTVTFDSPDDTCIEDSSINNNNLLDGRVSTSSQSASCTILPSSSNQTIHITVNPVDENDFNKKIQKQQQQEIKLYDKIKCNISNHVHKYNNTNRTTCSKVDSSQCADNSPSKSLSIDSYYITPTTQDTTTHGESVEKLIIATNVFIFCAFVAAIILAIVIIWLALGLTRSGENSVSSNELATLFTGKDNNNDQIDRVSILNYRDKFDRHKQQQQQSSTCKSLKIPICHKFRVGYTYTSLPNEFAQFDQDTISSDLMQFEKLFGVKCYSLLPLFICSIYAPKCSPDVNFGKTIPPCRSLCQDCRDGFRCDASRCVPHKWYCDGFIDCKDASDERNCSFCQHDEFHCGSGVCIKRQDICDGIRDCPDGRDERQCLRLNRKMASNGEGRLEAWSAITNTWQVVCGEKWDQQLMSNRACHKLGYRQANTTNIIISHHVTSKITNQVGKVTTHHNNKISSKSFFTKSTDSKCERSHYSVHLTCSHFECGRTAVHYQPSSRIVGGRESLPGSWPWLVGLHGGQDEVFFCGGILISENWVLSAAHCVGNQTDPNGWTIHLGLTRRTASPVFVRKRRVKAIIKHDNFNSQNSYGNDIALLLLSDAVNFDEFLRPVCLPPRSLDLPAKTKCTVVGWGRDSHDEIGDYSNVIHEVTVPIIPHSDCSKWYSLQDVSIGHTMLCAGYEEGEKDACQGDSGGPLVCKSSVNGAYFVAGIVSWGINCAQPNLPGIYTRVNIYRDWINNVTNSYGFPLLDS